MVKKKAKRLSINVTKSIEETLKLYCDDSNGSLPLLFKMIGMLTGISEKQLEDKKVLSISDQKEEFLDTVMSVCFFAGIFIAKKHPELIKKFKYEEFEEEDKKQKVVSPNYLG